ncbi:MAG: OmpA family protein [Bacteroidota bacterium]
MNKILLLTFLFFSTFVYAQTDNVEKDQDTKPDKKEIAKKEGSKKEGSKKDVVQNNQPVLGSLQLAEDLINQKQFKRARLELNAIINKRPKMSVAHRLLGLVHYELRDYEAALEAYSVSFELNPKLSRAAYFEYGEVLFRLGDILNAHENYKIYEKMKEERYANAKKEVRAERFFDALLPVRLQNCELLMAVVQASGTQPPENLGKHVNTPDDEYFPSVASDGSLLLYTTRKMPYPDLPEQYNENIFVSNRLKDTWGLGQPLKGVINTNENEGLAKFTYGQRKIFLASCQRDDPTRSCDIFHSEVDRKGAFFLEEPEGNLNSEAWDSQPCVTCDEKTLYFASTREGGYGGSDIWVSTLVKGEWTTPKNLGPNINTPGDEESPFIAADGATLYFASNGHPGFGEADLFMSRKQRRSWSLAEHLPYPINSQFQETGIFVGPDGKSLYFASDRLEGEGGLDVYQSELPQDFRSIPVIVLQGTVMDKNSGRTIQAVVNALHHDQKYSIETNVDGFYSMCIPFADSYAFHVDKEGYMLYVEATVIDLGLDEHSFKWDVLLESVSMAMAKKPALSPKTENYDYGVKEMFDFTDEIFTPEELVFYFDSGSSTLDPSTTKKIKSVAEVLKMNAFIKVAIKGFADDVGSAEQNKTLSEQRAIAVYEQLIQHGVPQAQIKLQGEGEIITEGDEGARSKNRRVEIEVIR